MSTLKSLVLVAALVAASFVYGTCRERSRAAEASKAERALNAALVDSQRREIGRLIVSRADLQARYDARARDTVTRDPVLQQAAERAIFASAHVAIGDPIRVDRLDTLPLRGPRPARFPLVPVAVQDSLWPGGAWLLRFPNDPRPHVVDSTVNQWAVWADQTITHYKVLVRDTIRPAWAQRDTQLTAYAALLALRDSTQANTDSQLTIYKDALVSKGLGTLRQQRRGTWLYAGALTAGVAANRWLRIDQDPGGYRDTWDSPDKLTHLFAGALLAETAHDGLKVPWKWAVPLTCAGAAGWEWSQGHQSPRDLVAGCSGALGAALVRRGIAAILH